ncbi:MAG TPA: iron-containing redox enzyme family protein [candidate division Zixibacteria bacterium]|nr:iron-containing redox enzyme family protein [candidate division Zixibacteria bacterium]
MSSEEPTMDGHAVVRSVIEEIVQPGIHRLMESRYFTELRAGTLSVRRIQGWSIQHYLHNRAILRAFALGMVKNAHDPDLFDYYGYQLVEERTHPDLAKKVGLALGLKEEDFAEATQIFECQIHSARTVYNTLLGAGPLSRASALVSESMVCRYSEEFNTYLRRNYGLGDDALEFFTVHMVADKEHTARSAERIARAIETARDERLVRESAQAMVRIKLGKFDGIYREYG